MKIHLSLVFLTSVFIATIIGFSVVYYYSPLSAHADSKALAALYLSLTTITTLGYGDIVVIDETLRLLTGVEAILGLILMGFMLNAMWHLHVSRIEERQKHTHKNEQKEYNLKALQRYAHYLAVVTSQYEQAYNELIGNDTGKQTHHGIAGFSALAGIFDPPLKMSDGLFESKLQVFQKSRAKMVDELRYVLAHFNLHGMDGVSVGIINFLCADTIISIMDELLSYSQAVKNNIADQIKKTTAHELSDITTHQHHKSVLVPVIALSHALEQDHDILSSLKESFAKEKIDLLQQSEKI